MDDITIHVEETEYVGLYHLTAVNDLGQKYTTGQMSFDEIGKAVDCWFTSPLYEHTWEERCKIWHPVKE